MATRATENQQDLVDVIVEDHRTVERAFAEYEQGGMSAEQQRDLLDYIIIELMRHAVAEEHYLYPVAREALSDGDRIADREIQEHAEAEEVMVILEDLEPDDPQFDRRTRELIADMRAHIQEEESDLLPRLREACSAEQLRKLGGKVVKMKQAAPSIPHPASGERPPAEMMLDPGAGMIDRMREAMQTSRG